MDHILIPKGTTISAPKAKDVTLSFTSDDEAIIFYEMILSLSRGEISVSSIQGVTYEDGEDDLQC